MISRVYAWNFPVKIFRQDAGTDILIWRSDIFGRRNHQDLNAEPTGSINYI